VPHHEDICSHRAQVGDGVQQGLTLGGRRARNVKVDHVGAQARGGNFESGACARGVFKEQVEDALAAQQRHLLDFAVADTHEVGGHVQDMGQDVPGQPFGGQEVDQFAVAVELGVAFVQHVQRPST
jgi:hypothetical protein